jgi:hypothetical protein
MNFILNLSMDEFDNLRYRLDLSRRLHRLFEQVHALADHLV